MATQLSTEDEKKRQVYLAHVNKMTKLMDLWQEIVDEASAEMENTTDNNHLSPVFGIDKGFLISTEQVMPVLLRTISLANVVARVIKDDALYKRFLACKTNVEQYKFYRELGDEEKKKDGNA